MLSTTGKKSKASREAARAKRKAEREAARSGTPDTKQEGWRETLRFWFWAIIIVLILRAFLFEPFRIPTPSMEKTLLVGDFLFVSKLHYGARTPSTIGIPFTGVYLPGLELPQTRLPGFDDPDRGDVAVFNYPPERAPVERKTPYIKRLVGMPGDTLVLLDKELYVNGERFPLSATQQENWIVTPSENVGIPRARLEEIGAELLGTIPGTNRLVVNGPPAAAEAIRGWSYVASVEGYAIPEGRTNGPLFPAGTSFNRDNYGPVAVPAAGQTVQLTPETWPTVEEVITRYEGHRAEVLGGGRYRIDGELADTYTFGQDYYFAMGDNRDNSQDSRFWGFVPQDHLVGKAVLVFFSLDLENRLLGLIPTPRLRGLQPIREKRGAKGPVGLASHARRESAPVARSPEPPVPILLAESISTNTNVGAPPKAAFQRIRPWVLVVVLALGAALGIRLFVAEAFRIPTASMERSLLVGDYVLVSKLHYGPRTPATLGLPFSDRYLRGVTLPTVRLPGFTAVERGDVVVFNHPTGQEPLDRRMHFIKRVVGLPGDTVALVGKEVQINGASLVPRPGVQTDWRVTLDPEVPFALDAFREAGAQQVTRESDGRWTVRMTAAEAEAVAAWTAVRDIRPAVSDRKQLLFPYGARQSLDDYGPVVVPKRGQTVHLTAATWPAVRDVIERHEGHTARRFADGRYEINGALTDRYTFEQDYYFVLGDNRDDSSDSRRWGFVPRNHLVGKAMMVYFSWDQRTHRPRFDRLFHPVR